MTAVGVAVVVIILLAIALVEPSANPNASISSKLKHAIVRTKLNALLVKTATPSKSMKPIDFILAIALAALIVYGAANINDLLTHGIASLR